MNIDFNKYRTPFYFQIESLVDDLEGKLSTKLKDDVVITQIDEYVPYSDFEAGMSDRDGEMMWKTIFPRGKWY